MVGVDRLPAEFLAEESLIAATQATTLGGGEKRPGVLGVPDDCALEALLEEGFWALAGVADLGVVAGDGFTMAILLPTAAAPGIGFFFSVDFCWPLWFCWGVPDFVNDELFLFGCGVFVLVNDELFTFCCGVFVFVKDELFLGVPVLLFGVLFELSSEDEAVGF